MIIAGTGHRPDKLGGYTRQAFEQLVALAENYLSLQEPDKVISGMALGWDQALAKAACRMGIPFIAAVPFAGQERMWPETSRLAYHKLLGRAEEVVTVCLGGYSPLSMQRRNEWMVDRADRVAALWDCSPGGTANCVRYCIQVKRPVDNLYPAWLHLTGRPLL